jgi:GTP-binding protein EngB required for normal cell division
MDASTDEEEYEYDADAVDTSDDYEMYGEEDTSIDDQEDILGDDLLSEDEDEDDDFEDDGEELDGDFDAAAEEAATQAAATKAASLNSAAAAFVPGGGAGAAAAPPPPRPPPQFPGQGGGQQPPSQQQQQQGFGNTSGLPQRNTTTAAAPTAGAAGEGELITPPQAQGLGGGLLARTVARVAPQKEPIVPDEKPDPKDEQATRAYELQQLRIKLLRLTSRLDQSPRNTIVSQVIYRLELAETLKSGKGTSPSGAQKSQTNTFERAVALAEHFEKINPNEELDFDCTILMIGKQCVGKSSVIKSLLGPDAQDEKTLEALDEETTKVRVIETTVCGMKLRLIDTPGLRTSSADIQYNSRIMGQAKKYCNKHKPDITLYFDRLDIPLRSETADIMILKQVTNTFGPGVWFNAIVVLTHAAGAPPDGPNGQPMSYELYVAQRSHVVQQTVRHASGDARLMNPVALAENHSGCRTNRTGDKVLPNGQAWKPQLLLLCFASKILAQANTLLKLDDGTQMLKKRQQQQQQQGKVAPLPFLLSSLITTRKPIRLEMGDDDFEDLEESIISGEPSPYDEPNAGKDFYMPKQLCVPAPDPQFPPSFDSDTGSHRYRYLDTNPQTLVRPMVDAHSYEHETGVTGFSVDRQVIIKDFIGGKASAQINKDKNDSSFAFEGELSVPHGKKAITTAGVDVQNVGQQRVYTSRAETRWKWHRVDKIIGGLSMSFVGGLLAFGTKIENRWKARDGMKVVVSTGAVSSKGPQGKDVAYGGNCEAIIRHSQDEGDANSSTIGASFMNWRGDIALGCNAMSSITLGKDTQLTGRFNLNSRGAGAVTVRATSNDKLQIAGVGLIPLLCAVWGRIFGD